MKKLLFGFSIYFRGMKIWASHRALLRLSIIPFVIDVVCLALGLYYTSKQIPDIIRHIVNQPQVWYQYIFYYLVLVVTALSLFFIAIFIVFVFANLLAFPFNDLLAEKTLALHEALPERDKGIRGWASKSVKNMNAMLKKTMILLVVGGVMAVAALIPGVGVIGALVGVFLMAVDRVDYAFDHYQMTFKQRRAFIRSHFFEIVGFAGALGLTTAIPVINMLVMPGSVVGAAALVAHAMKETKS